MGVVAQVQRNSPAFEPVNGEASLHDKVDWKPKIKRRFYHAWQGVLIFLTEFIQYAECLLWSGKEKCLFFIFSFILV